MKHLRLFLTVAMLIFIAIACNSQKRSKTKEENTARSAVAQKGGNTLVVFFSHTGENYRVGNIKVGNTKIVADYIQEAIGAELFEIVPVQSYQMPYKELTKVAQRETENNEKPAFKGSIENLDKYETIFVGGPIWWGTYPQVMFTFFDKYNLNNKTIIPFTTHEGSGLGSTVNDLQRIYPQADIKPGFALYGHKVRSSKSEVLEWLTDLGFSVKE